MACVQFLSSAINNDCLLHQTADDSFLVFAPPQRFSHLLLALFMTPHMGYKVSKFIKYFLWFMRSNLIESVRRQVAKVVLGVNNDLPSLWLAICHTCRQSRWVKVRAINPRLCCSLAFQNWLHHSAIYDWLYHLMPLIDAINRGSSGKVKDIAEFPVQSESQSSSDASWSASLTVNCSESLRREREKGGERGRMEERELQTSVPFQCKGNCHSSIWAKFQTGLLWTPRGVRKELLTFSSWTRDKFIKYFLFFFGGHQMKWANLPGGQDNLQFF